MRVWLGAALSAAVMVLLVWPSVQLMVHDWFARPEYSHGVLIPIIVGYVLYQQRGVYLPRQGGVLVGLLLAFCGLVLSGVGLLATIHAVAQVGLVLSLIGLFYTAAGTRGWRRTWIPLAMLLLMVPLPHFLQQALSAELQLASSAFGVWILQVIGISVYLHGNVIDLGTYQLQVLEACDGLRYLFPLLTVGLMLAYLTPLNWFWRTMIVVSALPITLLVNSLRIATIGIMVEYWGPSMAEGLLHDVQGWSMFLICVGLMLLGVRSVLRRVSPEIGLMDLLAIEPVLPSAPPQAQRRGVVFTWLIGAVGLVVLFALNQLQQMVPSEVTLERRDFLEFPLGLNRWEGTRDAFSQLYVDELQFDDYLLANYRGPAGAHANLYIAYYGDQRSGRAVHSPKTCLPGGGWEIADFEAIQVADSSGVAIPVNRALITRGNERQLVYYWFEQRGRSLANEYLVKWYLLLDSVLTGRSDGALVRLISPVPVSGDIQSSEQNLRQLFTAVREQLPRFVPGD